MSFVKDTAKKALGGLRNIHLRSLRRRLKNPNPTIIADTCFGGVVYHNLGLKFTSPTINMWVEKSDYLDFLEDLRGFLSVDMTEVTDSGYSYPVGDLTYNGKTVRFYGNHYKTFEDFRQKWNERKERVDYDNIFVIMLNADITPEEIERFDRLPYENKLMITKECGIERPYIVHHKLFHSPSYVSGDLMGYKSRFSVKRYMDDIDYVGFLNKKRT